MLLHLINYILLSNKPKNYLDIIKCNQLLVYNNFSKIYKQIHTKKTVTEHFENNFVMGWSIGRPKLHITFTTILNGHKIKELKITFIKNKFHYIQDYFIESVCQTYKKLNKKYYIKELNLRCDHDYKKRLINNNNSIITIDECCIKGIYRFLYLQNINDWIIHKDIFGHLPYLIDIKKRKIIKNHKCSKNHGYKCKK